MNKDTTYAVDYHESTKHSQVKLQMSRHYMDWDNKPRAFKVYVDLPSIALPMDFSSPTANAMDCIRGSTAGSEISFDIRELAQLLFFSAGITREMKFDSGTYYMRAASATGALYPIELYVVCTEIAGLSAGVYHFCPGDFSLTELRAGDYRARLAAMAGGNSIIASSPVTIAFTSLAWRNAWKYQARSYRHWFWDSGVIVANLLAVASSAGLRSNLAAGFVDSAVNDLLRLEQRKEAAVVLAPLGASLGESAEIDLNPDPVPALGHPKFLALSKTEVDYPEIWKLHEASSLGTGEEVRKWASSKNKAMNMIESNLQIESLALGDTILQRGSSRKFSRLAFPKYKLTNILYSSTGGVPFDYFNEKESAVDVYFVANAVDDLASGTYFYDRQANSLKELESKKEIASRNESGFLCLGQQLFSDASVVFFLMADLRAILGAFGNRGYRSCQLEAGVIAGKIYLSSYAQGLGASGSTFYDDAVTESFSPHAKAKSAMIAIGVGIPGYKARPGKILAARLTRSQLQ